MAIGAFRAKLIKTKEIAPEVKHFVFEVPEVDQLRYSPGQYVSLYAQVQERLTKRSYFLASPPDANRFEICLNRVREGAFSPYMFELRPGDTVDLHGPYGALAWREPPGDSLLIATGTGIAPLRAMLRARVPADSGHQYTLLYGVRYERNVLYREEFEEMARARPNFRFWPTISRPRPGWTGRGGRVQHHLLEATGDRRDLDVYVCGLSEMVLGIRNLLHSLGFDRQRVQCERYD